MPRPERGEGGGPCRPSAVVGLKRPDWTRALVQPAPGGPHRLDGGLHLAGGVLVDLDLPLPFWERSKRLAAAAADAGVPFAEPVAIRNRGHLPAAWRHAILLGYPGAWLRLGDRDYLPGPDPGWAPLASASGVFEVVDASPAHAAIVLLHRGVFFDARVRAPAGYPLADVCGRHVRADYWPNSRGGRFAVVTLPEGIACKGE